MTINLFYLDECFKKSAEYHVDKHVVKIILEATQVLSTTNNLIGSGGPYKTTHKNHPICIWARSSLDNYMWVTSYGLYLCEEYTYRFKKTHKCESLIKYMRYNRPNFDARDLTEHPKCMPDYCKVDCPIESYRNYYNNEKRDLFKWSGRPLPYWIQSVEEFELLNNCAIVN